jgi:hypothetical protein
MAWSGHGVAAARKMALRQRGETVPPCKLCGSQKPSSRPTRPGTDCEGGRKKCPIFKCRSNLSNLSNHFMKLEEQAKTLAARRQLGCPMYSPARLGRKGGLVGQVGPSQ